MTDKRMGPRKQVLYGVAVLLVVVLRLTETRPPHGR